MQYVPLYWSPYYFEQSVNLNLFEFNSKNDGEIGIFVA